MKYITTSYTWYILRTLVIEGVKDSGTPEDDLSLVSHHTEAECGDLCLHSKIRSANKVFPNNPALFFEPTNEPHNAYFPYMCKSGKFNGSSLAEAR
jgi:hypothetical protein